MYNYQNWCLLHDNIIMLHQSILNQIKERYIHLEQNVQKFKLFYQNNSKRNLNISNNPGPGNYNIKLLPSKIWLKHSIYQKLHYNGFLKRIALITNKYTRSWYLQTLRSDKFKWISYEFGIFQLTLKEIWSTKFTSI